MICYQQHMRRNPVLPCKPEQFWAAVNSPETMWKIETRREIYRLVDEYRLSGDKSALQRWLADSDYQRFCVNQKAEDFNTLADEDKLLRFADYEKGELECFVFGARCFDLSPVKEGSDKKAYRRLLKAIHLNGLFMFDADHLKEDPREAFERTQRPGFPWEIVLAHNTSSGCGLRLVAKARIELGNIADNQIELARAIGVTADDSCIDASRISFAPMYSDIYFINEQELFNYYDREFDEKYSAQYRMGNTGPTDDSHSFGDDGRTRAAASRAKTDTKSVPPGDGPSDAPTEPVDWLGYNLQDIIDARYDGDLPSKEKKSRHKESLRLGADLLIMLDGDKQQTLQVLKQQPWVRELIHERGQEEEERILEYADLKKREREKQNPMLPIPSKQMLAAIEKSTGKKYQQILLPGTDNLEPLPFDEWGEQIEQMFDTFPLLREVCKTRHRGAYPAIMFISSALLGTLMTRTWYHFYFEPSEERRLNYGVFAIGDPSAGKSIAGKLYKHLAKPILEQDRVGNEAINEYKRKVKERDTSDKEKRKAPLKEPNPIIRCFGARTANGVFIENMVRAVEHIGQKLIHLHLLTFDSELDNQTNLTKSGSWIDKGVFELKAFHNEEDSQSYKNQDSVNGPFDVFWNFIYTGTPISLRKKVNERNIGTGLAMRLACIPMPSSHFKMCKLDRDLVYDTSAEDTMEMWAYRLDKVQGELPIWPLVEHVYHWCEEHMALAEISNDYADEMLIKRVPYYGISIAIPFILMRHWDEWEQNRSITFDEKDFDLSTLAMNIQYRCQHYYFGEYARNYYEDQNRDSTTRNRSVRYMDCYAQLPDEFGYDDVIKVFGVNKDYSYTIISRFQKDKLIKKTENKKFVKLKKAI